MSARIDRNLDRYGFAVVFALCFAVAIGWIVLGGTAAVVRYWPGLLAPAVPGRHEPLLVAAARSSEPLSELIIDDVLSLVGITAAVVLVVMRTRSWSVRLLALALVASAGVFNLQSDPIGPLLDEATGLPLSATRGVMLHALACIAFILALLVFPSVDPAPRWRARIPIAHRDVPPAAVGLPLVVAVGLAATLLPCAISSALFFGFLVPAVGVVVLSPMVLRGPSQVARAQARMAFAVLVAVLATNSVLGLTTLALSAFGAPGLTLAAEPADGPISLLFWSSRAAVIAIAAIVLTAVLATRLWGVEKFVGRGLAAVLTVAVAGGVAVGVEALGWSLDLGGAPSSVLAAAAAAIVFLPAHQSAEGITDRLLYGVRPTPYRALADIAGLGQLAATGGPDLEGIARAVGEALGAIDCRITVRRHVLADRTYRWSDALETGRQMVSVPIRHGEEEIGTLAVEYAAVGGLYGDRRQLLEDIADGLGAVVEAHRISVELERQLRAALAHGAEIARARRRTVSEMDAERRRIERDLHDGVQHHLVSLRLALGLVEFEVGRNHVDAAVERLEALTGSLEMAEAVLAETVSGVQSILLVERGLVAAVEAVAGGANPVVVHSELPPGRRYPPKIENTVYYCCLESINNAVKHAPGASAVVRFVERHGELRFTVVDDGPGFSPQAQSDGAFGRGLRNLRQRISGAGGWIDIRSAPGRGTTVIGAVPVPPPQPVPVPQRAPDSRHETPDEVTTVLRIVGPGQGPRSANISVVTRPERRPAGRPATASGPSAGDAVVDPAPGLRDEPTKRFDDAPRTAPGEKRPASPHLPGPVVRWRPVDPQAGRSLVAEVRGLVVAARAQLDPRGGAGLAVVEASLDRPLRVGLLAPEDSDELVRCVLPSGPPAEAEVVATADVDPNGFDALIVFDGGPRGSAPPPNELPTIVVLDDSPTAGGAALRGAPVPRAVLRVGWRAARAAMRLTEADRAAMVAGQPIAALGSDANRLARDGKTLAELKLELVRSSGMPVLWEVLDRCVFSCGDVLRGRRAIAQIGAMVSRLPPGRAVDELRYGLDRILASRHEIAESALLDDLHGGGAELAGQDRAAALRLLGATGSSTTDRLGLPAVAVPWAVERAACRELARWQRIAASPLSPRQRRAAAVLVQTCERILADSLRRRRPPDGPDGGNQFGRWGLPHSPPSGTTDHSAMVSEPAQRAGDTARLPEDRAHDTTSPVDGQGIPQHPSCERCRRSEHDQWQRRRLLVRSLHDGPALRVSALTLKLGLISSRVSDAEPDLRQSLDGLQEELHVMVQELREITGTIYPPLLDQAGLGAALDEAAYRAAAPVQINAPDDRFGPAAEGAAYFAVTECLDSLDGAATPVDLVVRREDDMLTVRMQGIDVRHAPLMCATVWRMGGTLQVVGGPGVGTIVARIPCE